MGHSAFMTSEPQERIAILGGEGFIGRHLREAAVERGLKVRVFDVNACGESPDSVRLDVRDLTPDHLAGCSRVYHLAGILGTAETFDNAEETIGTNILGTLAVLKAARASSTPVTYVTLGNHWLNPYSITKNAATDLCLMFREAYGLAVQVVVTYNLYGPYQKIHPVRKIVPSFLDRLIAEQAVEIHGDGEQVVDLIYARDFAREMLQERASGVVHIGTGVPLTVNEVARLCAEALGVGDYRVRHVGARRGEPSGSVSLSPHGYRHVTATPVREGLAVTAAWYRERAGAAAR
jgi:nucleoside-diphosphate-sugar epimerase